MYGAKAKKSGQDREKLVKKILADANQFRSYAQHKNFSKQTSYLEQMLNDLESLGQAKFLFECLAVKFVPAIAHHVRRYKRHPKNLVLKSLEILNHLSS